MDGRFIYGEFSFLQCIHVKIDESWHLHFHQTYDNQIWQAGTSSGVDSNDANQVGAGNVMSTSRDFEKSSFQ